MVDTLRNSVRTGREEFIKSIIENKDIRNLEEYISVELKKYEKAVGEAATGGIDVDHDDFPVEEMKWTINQAVFFSSTVLTTIGKKLIILIKLYIVHLYLVSLLLSISKVYKLSLTILLTTKD